MTIDRLADDGPRDFALAALGSCGLVALLAIASRPDVSAVKPIVRVSEPAVAPVTRVTMPEPPPPPPVVSTPIFESTAAPQLHAQCVNDQSGDCTAALGFPAIADDGKTVLYARYPSDGGRGYPGISIDLVDVATSNVKRTYLIADPDEWDPDTEQFKAPIAKRVGLVQKLIGDGNYRTLAALPLDRIAQDRESFEFHLDDLDYKTTISAATEFPGSTEPDPDDMCGGVEIVNQPSAWFDAKTHNLIIEVLWAFGPSCHCGSETKLYVRSIHP